MPPLFPDQITPDGPSHPGRGHEVAPGSAGQAPAGHEVVVEVEGW